MKHHQQESDKNIRQQDGNKTKEKFWICVFWQTDIDKHHFTSWAIVAAFLLTR